MTTNWDPEKPLFAHQPWKSFYSVYFLLFTAVRISFLAISNTIPRMRSVESWSFKTAFTVSLSRLAFWILSKTRFRTPQPLGSGAAKDLFVKLDPPADFKVYTGILENLSIQPSSVASFWLPNSDCLSTISAATHSRNWVSLHFHGGGYVLISSRSPTAQQGPKQLCEELPADGALCLEYRLSSESIMTITNSGKQQVRSSLIHPQGSYPAQLQDAITAYNYLIQEKRISASRILVSGDSSGAHLAILLLRHLMKHSDIGLPSPRALLLHSPWLDLCLKR